MKKYLILTSILTVSLLILPIIRCARSVSPEDVYHHHSKYTGKNSAKNITVEQTPDGMKITGSEITVIFKPPTQYRFELKVEPKDKSLEYKVEEIPFDNRTGSFYMKVNLMLGEGSSVPAQIPMKEATYLAPKLFGVFPDALGSQDISVKINKQVGYTKIAGLKFTQEATINIWKDGVMEIGREGVEGTSIDRDVTAWISKKVKVEGKVAIIMVRIR